MSNGLELGNGFGLGNGSRLHLSNGLGLRDGLGLRSNSPGLLLSDLGLGNGSELLLSNGPGLLSSDLGLGNGSGLHGSLGDLGLLLQSCLAYGSSAYLRHGGHDGDGARMGPQPLRLRPNESKVYDLHKYKCVSIFL